MIGIRYDFWGVEELASALQAKSETDFRKVERKNILEIRNRAVATQDPSRGGTPVDSSQLRIGASVSADGSAFGYIAHYAPHVEYGHRQEVGRYVHAIRRRLVQPFVPGQYFLRTNVNIQRPIFKEDLINEMRKS